MGSQKWMEISEKLKGLSVKFHGFLRDGAKLNTWLDSSLQLTH